MAEELRIWEKHPGERRIDHPDFPDVQETTFAKGVITDFQLVSTDPFRVKPLVKVRIGEQEFDPYIPLFYKPKAGYWEDGEVGAQDYDQESRAYKQAWQSFRCGDEVVVLLKKGKPQMVLGFYDNYPRIGEDVVKWIPYGGDPPEYGRVSQRTNPRNWGHYNFPNDIGPDGKPLHLVKKAEAIWSSIYYWNDSYIPRYFMPRTNYGVDILQDNRFKTPKHPRHWCPHYLIDDQNGNCIWGGAQCRWSDPNDRVIAIRYGEMTAHTIGSKCSAHLVPVGPILYVVYSLWEPYFKFNGSSNRNEYKSGRTMCDDLKEWLETYQDGSPDWDKPGLAYSMTQPPIFENLEDNTISIEDTYEDMIIINQIKAGLYTEELYRTVMESQLSPYITWLSWQNSDWNRNVNHFPYAPTGLYWQWFGENNLRYGGPLEDFIYHEKDKLMVRPHTKTELIEAGLWPPDDNKEKKNE